MSLITLLLLGPAVLAAPPASNLSAAFSPDGQEITDLAMDPTGQFIAAVVNVDKLKITLPGSPAHRDIYPCDFGAPGSVSTGAGCLTPGLSHTSTESRTATSLTQVVDYTSVRGVGYYVVGGPGEVVSVWTNNNAHPLFERNTTASGTVVNVSISPDGARAVAGVSTANTAGRIMVFRSESGGPFQWSYDLPDQSPTAMAYSRLHDILAVGTTGGIVFLRPSGAAPRASDVYTIDTEEVDIRHVAISRTGDAVVAGTESGVFFANVNVSNGKPSDVRYSRQLDPAFGAQRVAITLDGLRFAAASGPSIHFYRNLNSSFVAEELGSKFTTPDGAPVQDLAYDATGSLLVAIAGNRVYGFGPSKNTPIWSFDATLPQHGSLDAPLRKVVISDGAERIVVAGKTKLMPYRTLVSASGVFDQQQNSEVLPASNVKVSFTLQNTGSLPDNYSFIPHYPSGWNGNAPEAVALAPDESATINLSVDVPPGLAPGIYGLDVQVRSKLLFDRGSSNTAIAGPALNVTVPRAVVLNVTTSEDRLPPLKQGNDATVPVTVRNRGNAEGVVNLSATQVLSRGSSWPVRFDKEQVRIPAGGETIVNMVLTAPQNAGSGDRNDITIRAKEGTMVEATRLVTVYVDPRFGADLKSNNSVFYFSPGELVTIRVNVTNTGNLDDFYNMTTLITPTNVANDWSVTVENNKLTVPQGVTRAVNVNVRAFGTPREASLVIRAASNASAETESGAITLSLLPRPPTPPTDKSFLPDLAVGPIVAILALAAIAGRRFGGRR